MRMFLSSAAIAAALICGIPADAADLPVKAPPIATPVFTWSGCYGGINVGGARSRQDADTVALGNINANQAPVFVTLTDTSVIGGVQAGCNVQFSSRWVAGAEVDVSGTDLKDTQFAPNLFFNGLPVGSGGITLTAKTNALATLRGRFGYAFIPNAMIYVTGGGALAHTQYSGLNAFAGGCPNCVGTAFSATSEGWVAGTGVEWAPWSNNWLIRGEYLHYDIGGASSRPSLVSAFNFHRLRIDEGRVALSYKFY